MDSFSDQSKASPPAVLVGDILTNLIRKKTKKPPCMRFCKATAAKMNDWGVKKCRDKVDELGEEIHQNVKRMGWSEAFAIKAADAVLTATVGNSEYCKLVIEACDTCEKRGGNA